MLIQDIPQQLQDREILWFREILSADDFILEKVFSTDAEFVDEKCVFR